MSNESKAPTVWSKGQCVRGGVVFAGTFKEPADGYRPTVGVVFDDGGSGCIRMTSLTALNQKVPEARVNAMCKDGEMLLEVAARYRASGATTVMEWLMGGEDAPEQLYYIQFLGQGYVGNCMLLWGPNNNGYTTELDKAGLYTTDQLRRNRPEDQPWPREVLDQAAVRHVRGEGLFPRDVGWVFDDELNEWRER